MRNPGPVKPQYDKERNPDDYAEEIAKYILKMFEY